MQTSWLVVVPPLVVILLAFLTRKILSSLFCGVFVALLILHKWVVTDACFAIIVRLWKTTELGSISSLQTFWQASNLCIMLFLLLVGILIMMIRSSGGAYAYGNFVMRYLKLPYHAEMATLILSLFFFIDDYLSSISVGSVMQTVTDRFQIPRVKLALLVNSMAAPLVVIVPVSSWVAHITMQLKNTGINLENTTTTLLIADPFHMYLRVIPYLFYSFAVIAVLWFIVVRRISYGTLYKHEEIAAKTGNLFAGKTSVTQRTRELSVNELQGSSLADFLVPVGSLFASVALTILYFGNWRLFGGNNGFITALRSTQIAPALCTAAAMTVFISMLFLVFRKRLTLVQLPMIILDGIRLMISSVIMLALVWTLSELLKNDLATGNYLANLFIGQLNISYFPAVFFLLTAITTTLMGSAWGAISIYIPIALPMLVTLSGVQVPVELLALPLMIPLLGAIVSGAVVGNHLSPIADNTLMAATSSGAYVIDVVKSQISFTVPIACATALGYLLAGSMVTAGYASLWVIMCSLSVIIIVSCIYFSLIQLLKSKRII